MGLDISFTQVQEVELTSHNITHNLAQMAEECGLYYPLWRPEEIFITKASELLPLVEEGLAKLKADPEKYKEYNAPNGWGTYDNFVRFVEEVLQSCKEHPEAVISACR